MNYANQVTQTCSHNLCWKQSARYNSQSCEFYVQGYQTMQHTTTSVFDGACFFVFLFFWGGGGGGGGVAFHCFGFPFLCKHWLDSHVLSFCSCLCSIRCMIQIIIAHVKQYEYDNDDELIIGVSKREHFQNNIRILHLRNMQCSKKNKRECKRAFCVNSPFWLTRP